MKYITLLSFLIVSSITFAQAPRGFSLSAGVTQTSIKSDDLLADPGLGFRAGTVFNWGYHETYNYQIEIFYNRGAVELLAVDENYESKGNAKYTLSSTDVGFYFNYYILKPEEDKFYVGPQLGMTFAFAPLLVPVDDANDEYYLPHLSQENDLQTLPKINYSAGIGLTGGYNDFRFDLRYTMGLNNILQDVEANSYDEFNQYTGPTLEGKVNSISFTVSYRLWKMLGME